MDRVAFLSTKAILNIANREVRIFHMERLGRAEPARTRQSRVCTARRNAGLNVCQRLQNEFISRLWKECVEKIRQT